MTDLSTPTVTIVAETNRSNQFVDLVINGSRNVDELSELRKGLERAGFRLCGSQRHGDVVTWTMALPANEIYNDIHPHALQNVIKEAKFLVL